jgi:hypothetical protein
MGNPSGQGLLEERIDLKERMKRLEDEIICHRYQITGLQQSIKTLALSSEGYRRIRNRFIDVYCRDIRNDLGGKGYANVLDGNEAAHEGDAIADAALYTSHTRHDEAVLIEIYGLSANQISYLGKCQTSLSKLMRSQAYAL